MSASKNNDDILLELKNTGVYYWRRTGFLRKEKYWALRDVTLTLRPGESLGVIGRNGAGKSTLLKMLAGIIKPDSGEMTKTGCSTALLSLQIGFAPHLTGRENALLSGMLLGLEKEDVIEKMDWILDFSELGDFFDQPISTYSSGMKARLGFSVAFQVSPDILLIDEVLGVGDEDFHVKSTKLMQEKMHGKDTIVLVSHSGTTIQQVCDRVVWIEDGCTRAEGKPNDVLQQYYDHMKAHVAKIASQ